MVYETYQEYNFLLKGLIQFFYQTKIRESLMLLKERIWVEHLVTNSWLQLTQETTQWQKNKKWNKTFLLRCDTLVSKMKNVLVTALSWANLTITFLSARLFRFSTWRINMNETTFKVYKMLGHEFRIVAKHAIERLRYLSKTYYLS